MKNDKFKFGFSIFIILITIIFIFNNILFDENLLIAVSYIKMFLIFIAYVISIVRARKENNKINVIPCIIITCIVILTFILNNTMVLSEFYMELFLQIGLVLFLYELIDLLKIKIDFNVINVVIAVVCIFVIIVYVLIDFLSIEKYKRSLIDISNFFLSNNLSYENLSKEFNKLVLEHIDYDNALDSLKQKKFIIPSYYCKVQYSLAIGSLNDILTLDINNNKTLNKYRQDLNDKIECDINNICSVERTFNKIKIVSIIFVMLEISILFFVSMKNKE